jgi:hypothetical protein
LHRNVSDEHPWLAHNASATLDLDVPVRSRRLNVHNWTDPSLRRARKSIARRGICSSRSHLRPDGVSSRRISRSGGAIFFGGDPPGCRSLRMDGGYARHATRRRNGCRLTSVRRSDRVFIHVVAAGIRRLAIGVRIVMAPLADAPPEDLAPPEVPDYPSGPPVDGVTDTPPLHESPPVTVVPEPTPLLLFISAAASWAYRRRMRAASNHRSRA